MRTHIMLSRLLKASILLPVLAASSAWAANTVTTFSFNSPTGLLAHSRTYTSVGTPITTATAYAFNTNGTNRFLYGRNDLPDEYGIGISGTSSDNEITSTTMVQVDFQNIWALSPLQVSLVGASVQSGESYAMYGSNSLGTLGTFLQSGTTDAPATFNLFLSGAHNAEPYRYIAMTAGAFDVLWSNIAVTVPGVGAPPPPVPEPATLSVLALGALLLLKRRK